ncbi:MAG: NAD-dependent epimerase/dehydratase family protein [Lysobacteraceae bacterium]|nr:MAG: NAD-dependent epimerase/dehydratase family protein [Xanthomonadaceae bacterium]
MLKLGALGLAGAAASRVSTVAAGAAAHGGEPHDAPPASAAPLAAGASDTTPADVKPLDILILGGTGLTGPHQVRYALARGHRVTIFNRGRKQPEWPGHVQQLLGDRDKNDYASIRAEVDKGRRWDICIDNPSSVPIWIREAAAALKGHVNGYMMISSVSAYADNAAPGQDETAPLATFDGEALKETSTSLRADMGKYAGLKAASEAETRRQFGDRATIVRPGLIVGPGDETDRFSYWPLRLRRGGEVLCPGDGRDPVQFIDARDLGEWMIRLAEQKTRGAFNAFGPDYGLDMTALLYGIRASTTQGAKFVFVPAEFLEAQNVSPWSDMPVWVPSTGDSAGFHTRRNAKAVAAGLTFRSIADTVTATLAWYDAQPQDRRDAGPRSGIKPEREAEVLAKWKAQRGG